MKPFNLEEYLANPSRKVVTRDGRSVRIKCTDAKGEHPVIGLVDRGDYEAPKSFTKDGRLWNNTDKNSNDLFFATEKHEGWVNIYRGESGFYLRGNPYKSKEEADEVAKANYKTFCTTVKIEWEE